MATLSRGRVLPKNIFDIVPFYVDNHHSLPNKEEKSRLLSSFSDINEPCSLSVRTEPELYQHMFNAYLTAHYHYILAKSRNMKFTFPSHCCGYSSLNVMLSLLKQGYAPACLAGCSTYDHSYVAIPFVMPNLKGVIIVDPTSDQLWEDDFGETKPFDFQALRRNAVFVKEGAKWNYCTYWRQGANLYPNHILDLNILRKREDYMKHSVQHSNGSTFFKLAFRNPIEMRKKKGPSPHKRSPKPFK